MPDLMRTPTQMAFKIQELEEKLICLTEQMLILLEHFEVQEKELSQTHTKVKNGKKTKKTK